MDREERAENGRLYQTSLSLSDCIRDSFSLKAKYKIDKTANQDSYPFLSFIVHILH